jgi:hypothetical protein
MTAGEVETRAMKFARATAILSMAICLYATRLFAASDLTLAPNISFTNDSSKNFPLQGKDLNDAAIPNDRPTLIFFGAAHCWNTAREAERVVKLYPEFKDKVRFLVVDLKNVPTGQQELAKQKPSCWIPGVVVLDKKGKVIYKKSGETALHRGDTSKLRKLLNSAL